MGGSIDSISEAEDRFIRKVMGQIDPKDYGVDVDSIDKAIDEKLAKVKQPERARDLQDTADE